MYTSHSKKIAKLHICTSSMQHTWRLICQTVKFIESVTVSLLLQTDLKLHIMTSPFSFSKGGGGIIECSSLPHTRGFVEFIAYMYMYYSSPEQCVRDDRCCEGCLHWASRQEHLAGWGHQRGLQGEGQGHHQDDRIPRSALQWHIP